MIGNRLEQSIISVFQENLSDTFSINELSKRLKKAYPYINKKTNFFLKEGVLKKFSIGKSYQCFLNLENEKTKIFMSMNEVNKKDALIQKHQDFLLILEEIQKICSKVKIETIIFHEDQIIFVLDNLEHAQSIDKIEQNVVLIKKFKLSFLTKKSFKENFLSNAELQKNHVILFNINAYLNILSELSDKFLLKGIMKRQNDTKIR